MRYNGLPSADEAKDNSAEAKERAEQIFLENTLKNINSAIREVNIIGRIRWFAREI